MSKTTEKALIARGIDSFLASNLASNGYTIKKLKGLKKVELINLGLSSKQIDKLFSEKRPDIPIESVDRVLYKNKYTCCVCRDPNKPVILHHIIEWSRSRDHSEENLAVLCLEHHGEAHTNRELSQNLDDRKIKSFKQQWEKDCETKDIEVLLNLRDPYKSSNWAWINIKRLFEIFFQKNLTIDKEYLHKNVYDTLRNKGFINENNILTDESEWPITNKKKFYFIDFQEGIYIMSYLATVLDITLSRVPVIDITREIKNRTWLKSMLHIDSFICFQAAFYFVDLVKTDDYKSNVREAYYQANGIKIIYTYEDWYCLSSSAKHCWMAGHQIQTIVGKVRSIQEENGDLIINISCIAAGSYFKKHPDKLRTKFDT